MKGFWEITTLGIQRLALTNVSSAKPTPNRNTVVKDATNLLFDAAKYIKHEDFPATIVIGTNEITIRLGENIKRTTVERAPVTVVP